MGKEKKLSLWGCEKMQNIITVILCFRGGWGDLGGERALSCIGGQYRADTGSIADRGFNDN
jgi:hypothetical protein